MFLWMKVQFLVITTVEVTWGLKLVYCVSVGRRRELSSFVCLTSAERKCMTGISSCAAGWPSRVRMHVLWWRRIQMAIDTRTAHGLVASYTYQSFYVLTFPVVTFCECSHDYLHGKAPCWAHFNNKSLRSVSLLTTPHLCYYLWCPS